MAKKFSAAEIKALRRETNLSQREFAARYGLSLGSLREWEQGTRVPNRAAQLLFAIIEHDPLSHGALREFQEYQTAAPSHQFNYKGKEEWKDIPSLPNYQASNKGRIRSLDRLVPANGTTRFAPGKLLSQRNSIRDGKIMDVRVYINVAPKKPHLVHRLVLEAFKGPAPKGLIGCHNDGNAANNSLQNLRWDTPLSNVEDTIKHSGKVPILSYRLFGDRAGGGSGGIKKKSFVSDYLCGLAGLI